MVVLWFKYFHEQLCKQLARTMPFLRMYHDVHEGEKRVTLDGSRMSGVRRTTAREIRLDRQEGKNKKK